MDGPLPGGNMNDVERRGDTVLRNAGPWTPTVHRYLRYLAAAGIDWAPQPLGIEGGRERLSFVEGDVPLYPLPAWVWSDSVLEEGARRLRELHDASTGFGLDGTVWQAPAKVPAEVICHNDFAPHNLAFHDGALVGAIDFDMCSPGPRLWDLAYFATRAVPLTAVTPKGAPGMDVGGRPARRDHPPPRARRDVDRQGRGAREAAPPRGGGGVLHRRAVPPRAAGRRDPPPGALSGRLVLALPHELRWPLALPATSG